MPRIFVDNISVYGVDTLQRANSLKSFLLHKKQLRNNKIKILENVTFEANKGDRIGVLGLNGSGKSSLMKTIIGTYPPSSGKVFTSGKIIPMIDLGLGMDHNLSGRKNIKTIFLLNRNIENYSKEIEQAIIDFSEIGDFIDRPMNTYSSGMQARLVFSASIFQDTDILILDEVLSTGDQGFVKKAKDYMKNKWSNASISIMISHSTQQILEFCDTCYVMHKGRVINHGSTKTMIDFYTDKKYATTK